MKKAGATGRLLMRRMFVQPRVVAVLLIWLAGLGFVAGEAAAQTGADSVYTWGDNMYGQLGNGESQLGGGASYVWVPTRVLGPGGNGYLTNVIAIAAGYYHTLAVTSDGAVYAWGCNSSGQLGNGAGGAPNDRSEVPVRVVAPQGEAGYLTGVVDVRADGDVSVALKADDTVWMWGGGALPGTVITAGGSNRPVQVLAPEDEQEQEEFLQGIEAIDFRQHLLALRGDGTVIGCGRNMFGQLGVGDQHSWYQLPLKAILPAGASIVAVSCPPDSFASVALRADGTALAWGWCGHFLPEGIHTVPQVVLAQDGQSVLQNVAAIDWEFVHFNDGTAWIWDLDTDTPVQVEGPWAIGLASDLDRAYGRPGALPTSPFLFPFFAAEILFLRSDGTLWVLTDPSLFYEIGGANPLGLVPVWQMTHVVDYARGGLHGVVTKDEPIDTFTLTVQSDPPGATSFTVEPAGQQFDFGQVVSVSASVSPGWIWRGWTGDLMPVPEGCDDISDYLVQELMMAGNRSLVAHFDPGPTFTFSMINACELTPTDWAYQNTPSIIANAGHAVRVTATVTDLAGNYSASLSVSKVPGSGSGEVFVVDDPESNPLVKYVYGSMRSDGSTGTGTLDLQLTVTGNIAGQTSQQVSFRCRKLGDIDGNGGTEPGDMALLINRLNGMPLPPGYNYWMFDLDTNGGAEPGDMSLLVNILNGIPIP